MRILFVNYEYPPLGGGGGIFMAAVARVLARRHAVTVLTSRAMRLPAEAMDEGVRVLRTPVLFRKELAAANLPSMAMYLPAGLWTGRKLLRRSGFDIVNTHFVVPSGPLGDWIARRANIPNVLSVHGGDLFDPSKTLSPHRHGVLRALVSRLLTRADAVVAQSRDTFGRVKSLYGVDRQVDLIPLGIERPSAAKQATRSEFGLPEDAFVMTTVGRIVRRKAVVQLIDMLAALDRPDARLLVLGDGPDMPAVMARARELGVAARVQHLRQMPDAEKYRILKISDVFVSTSQHEGFGLAFLEAMAFGLPVVCYDCGGQTDFLDSPATGFVIRLNELGEFTNAVRQLHDSPQARASIRATNLGRVEQYFIDRSADAYEGVFERAIVGFAGR